MAIPVSRLKVAPMQRVVETILQTHGLVEAFTESTEFHLKLDNPPYMPLVIERQGDVASVMHYFIQNGDVMADPEVEFQLPHWSPMAITQHPLGIYRAVHMYVNGRQVLNTRLLAELESFARLWAMNLRAQGFTDAARVTPTSLTHARLLLSQAAA